MSNYTYEREPILEEGQISQVYGLPFYEKVDVQKMVEEAYARGDKKIVIPRGAYRVHAGEHSGHLFLNGMKDFVVEGYDVVLVCQDFRNVGILVTNCERVTVSGFSVDFEPYGYAQGTITAFSPEKDYFDIHIDYGYQCDFDDPVTIPDLMTGDFYSGTTYDRIKGIRTHGYQPKSVIEDLGDRNFRIHLKVQSDWEGRLGIGDVYCFSSRPVIGSGFISRGNSQLYVKDVTVWAGLCGVAESYTKKQSFYDNFRVMPGPKPYRATQPRICSTVADACHMSSNYEGARMENCLFDHSGDDGINFYGGFARVAEQVAPDTVIFAVKNGLPLAPGERLHLYGMDTDKIGEAVILEAEQMPKDYQSPTNLVRNMGAAVFHPREYYKAKLDREIPVQPGDWMSNSSQVGNGFILKNNVYRNIRPRGVLIKASNGLVENCTFHNIGTAGIQIRPEFNWTEAGYAHNVVIRNCTFINCGDSTRGTITVDGGKAEDNMDLVIEDNTFIQNGSVEVSLAEARNVTIRGNRFGLERPNEELPLVLLWNGDLFNFDNNEFNGGSVLVAAGYAPKNILNVEPKFFTVCSNALATGKQGHDGWHFQYAPIGTDNYQDFENYIISDKLQDGWWHGEEENYDDGCIRRWWFDTYMLPGEQSDVVKTFVCPKDGEILINAASFIVGAPTTDGINVCVRKNQEQLWPKDREWETKFEGINTAFAPIKVTVKTGDCIYFRVNKNGTAENDGLDWNPTILYLN